MRLECTSDLFTLEEFRNVTNLFEKSKEHLVYSELIENGDCFVLTPSYKQDSSDVP